MTEVAVKRVTRNRPWGTCPGCFCERKVDDGVIVFHRRFVFYRKPLAGVPGVMVNCEGSGFRPYIASDDTDHEAVQTGTRGSCYAPKNFRS